jgi:hypothetical protein
MCSLLMHLCVCMYVGICLCIYACNCEQFIQSVAQKVYVLFADACVCMHACIYEGR